MKPDIEIKHIQLSLAPVFKKYQGQVLFAYCFGSTVTGQRSLESDVDLAFYMADSQFGLDQRFQLNADCMRALNTNNVDVVILNTLRNTVLADAVAREGVVIYCTDDDRRMAYEVAVQHAAMDFLTQRKAVMGV